MKLLIMQSFYLYRLPDQINFFYYKKWQSRNMVMAEPPRSETLWKCDYVLPDLWLPNGNSPTKYRLSR